MAKVSVYTDESSITQRQYLLIGGLWLKQDHEPSVRAFITNWRTDSGELKWNRVKRRNINKYKSLVDLYFDNLIKKVHFRCIVVNTFITDHDLHSDGDEELGFYKFYFLLISRRIIPGHEYWVTVDRKRNKGRGRLETLTLCINRWCAKQHGTPDYPIQDLSPRDSDKDDLLQLADVLLGATAFAWNQSQAVGDTAKHELLAYIEAKLGRKLSYSTPLNERRVNIWKWRPSVIKKAPQIPRPS